MVAEVLQHRAGHPPLGGDDVVVVGGRGVVGRALGGVVGPRPQPAGRRQRRGGADGGGQRAAGRHRGAPDGDAGGVEGRGQRRELGVGARQHGGLAGAQDGRVERAHEPGDGGRLVVGVGEAVELDRSAVVPGGDGVGGLAGRAQHVHPGADDGRGRAVVDGQVDDLDPVQVTTDIGQQRRVGAVEAVDGLRRVADQEEVSALADEQAQQPELDRVEVLGLVHEHVLEAVPYDLGPQRILGHGRRRHRQQVVEVDDAPAPLQRFVPGQGGGDVGR